MTTTTLKLERGPDPKESLCYGPPTHPPATPGEWFARRYPAAVEQWGAPMLEAVINDQQGNQLVRPLELNDNFFAAILSDQQFGHSVVFYQPEQQWFFHDPADQLYHPTTEEKLIALLSSLLVRCAEEMPKNVDTIQLFCRFREEDKLKAVVKRARAVHAAESSFFDKESSNQRAGGVESFSDLARGFVRSTVKRQPDQLLSVGECYQRFSEYCRNNDSAAEVSRQQFKQLIAEVIREEFGLGLRGDIRNPEGRCQRGWKGLVVESCQRN
jgi:hypothetical protein